MAVASSFEKTILVFAKEFEIFQSKQLLKHTKYSLTIIIKSGKFTSYLISSSIIIYLL